MTSQGKKEGPNLVTGTQQSKTGSPNPSRLQVFHSVPGPFPYVDVLHGSPFGVQHGKLPCETEAEVEKPFCTVVKS